MFPNCTIRASTISHSNPADYETKTNLRFTRRLTNAALVDFKQIEPTKKTKLHHIHPATELPYFAKYLNPRAESERHVSNCCSQLLLQLQIPSGLHFDCRRRKTPALRCFNENIYVCKYDVCRFPRAVVAVPFVKRKAPRFWTFRRTVGYCQRCIRA